jgi:hypothetical protein
MLSLFDMIVATINRVRVGEQRFDRYGTPHDGMGVIYMQCDVWCTCFVHGLDEVQTRSVDMSKSSAVKSPPA